MNGNPATPLLELQDLWIDGEIGGEHRRFVTGVDLSVGPGEVVAIVGESGSGKSLTGRSLVGLLPRGLRASGAVLFEGHDVLGLSESELRAVRGSGIALVLQDPFTTLNPLMKCRTQMAPTHQGRRSAAQQRADAVERLKEVGIHDPHVADRYPWQLSGGMRQRVALAAALANDPKVLIADEFTTALDVTTQKEIWLLLRRIQEARGMGLLMITHDLRMAFSVSDRVFVMYAGSLMEVGEAGAVADQPQHPYTLGLLLSEPGVEEVSSSELLMRGNVPDADDVLDRCAFAARCPWAAEVCVARRPAVQFSGGRGTACVRATELEAEMRELRQRRAESAQEPVVEVPPTDAARPVVVVRELAKTFRTRGDDGERDVHALREVSLEIRPGECVGLVGESGSGKTTLARCLVALESPTSGTIEIAGVDATHQSDLGRERWRELRDAIQYVFQDPYSSLNPTKTVGGTLSEAVALRSSRSREEVTARVAELLELVGLPADYSGRKPVALSGGERQRVAIARALAREPRVVICDEPVSSLDVSVQAQVLELLNEIRARTGVSYLFITHDLAVVRQVADRICVLRRGQVVEEGAALAVLERPQDPYTRELLAAAPGQWDRDTGVALATEGGASAA
jgi:peptide/nickel transport system ATP-binding protein